MKADIAGLIGGGGLSLIYNLTESGTIYNCNIFFLLFRRQRFQPVDEVERLAQEVVGKPCQRPAVQLWCR